MRVSKRSRTSCVASTGYDRRPARCVPGPRSVRRSCGSPEVLGTVLGMASVLSRPRTPQNSVAPPRNPASAVGARLRVSDGTRTRDRLDHNQEVDSRSGQRRRKPPASAEQEPPQGAGGDRSPRGRVRGQPLGGVEQRLRRPGRRGRRPARSICDLTGRDADDLAARLVERVLVLVEVVLRDRHEARPDLLLDRLVVEGVDGLLNA